MRGQTHTMHHPSSPHHQHYQHQHSQPSIATAGPWGHVGRGGGGQVAAVDPWGRPFSAGGGGDNGIGPSPINGSGAWNHASAHMAAHNGWGGGYNHNGQQSQLQQQHNQQQPDHRLSHYVTGLPREIIDQVCASQLLCTRTEAAARDTDSNALLRFCFPPSHLAPGTSNG